MRVTSRRVSPVAALTRRLGVYEPEQRLWLPHLTVVRFRARPRLVPEPPDLGAVRTDVTKLRQALSNLLNNAAKFTHDGKIDLDVWREKGGVLITPSASDLAAMNAKLSSIGDDLSKDNADLNAAVN